MSKSFTIVTLEDIYELPKIEQMETCLDEMKESMMIAREARDKLVELFGDGVPSLVKWPESVEWIDDGKGEVGATFVHEGEVILDITKKNHE